MGTTEHRSSNSLTDISKATAELGAAVKSAQIKNILCGFAHAKYKVATNTAWFYTINRCELFNMTHNLQ